MVVVKESKTTLAFSQLILRRRKRRRRERGGKNRTKKKFAFLLGQLTREKFKIKKRREIL